MIHRPEAAAALLVFAALAPFLATAQEPPSAVRIEGVVNPLTGEILSLPSELRATLEREAAEVPIRTRYFRVLGDHSRLAIPMTELGEQFDRVFEYVSERVGLPPEVRSHLEAEGIPVRFRPPETGRNADTCPRRGLTAGTSIMIFADGTLDATPLLGVLAHEVGHVLMIYTLGGYYQTFGRMMPEGFATWAGGRYVLDWYGIDSLQQAVADRLADGSYLSIRNPLNEYLLLPSDPVAAAASVEECIAQRDLMYTAWGAFVEFLIERGSQAELHALLRSGGLVDLPAQLAVDRYLQLRQTGEAATAGLSPSSATRLQYEELYGLGLAALETVWLNSL